MITAHSSQGTWSNGGCDVLLAVDAYMPWSGGSRIYYDNLYRRLSGQYRLRVTVETSHCEGDQTFDAEFSSEMLTIYRQGTRLPDWKVSRAPLLVRKMLRIGSATSQLAPAAIHCGDLFPQAFAGMLVRKLRGVPLLVFVHGDEISQTEGRRLQPHLRNAIYRAADSVVVANRFAYERVIDILGSVDRVTMITPGVDMKRFYPGPRPAWICDQFQVGDDPLLVTVGRLVKKKGHETVLRSLPVLLRKYPHLKYLIVGDGPERDRLEVITSELGLRGSVSFAGNVPNYNVGDFYRAADIFCLVNQEDAYGDIESFGMVFVEAGACGKPVIGGAPAERPNPSSMGRPECCAIPKTCLNSVNSWACCYRSRRCAGAWAMLDLQERSGNSAGTAGRRNCLMSINRLHRLLAGAQEAQTYVSSANAHGR